MDNSTENISNETGPINSYEKKNESSEQNITTESGIVIENIANAIETVTDMINEKTNVESLDNNLGLAINGIENSIQLQNGVDTKIIGKVLENEQNVNPGNEINSDEIVQAVVNDIIDSLQPEKSEKILSQVQIKAPEGFISEMEWRIRETALLVKIAKLEEDERIKQEAFNIKLKMKCDENEMLKAKLKTLDTELRAVCSKPNSKNKEMVSKIKKNHDDLLTKARGMIFEKTKMIKNQELKLEALTAQVASLRDMVAITKDMLNIKNMECQHLQDRMDTMELRLQAEKERQSFMNKKIESEKEINQKLKLEYLKQAELFKKLKEVYQDKVSALEEKENKQSPSGEPPSDRNENK